jgi:hypothetical protein
VSIHGLLTASKILFQVNASAAEAIITASLMEIVASRLLAPIIKNYIAAFSKAKRYLCALLF